MIGPRTPVIGLVGEEAVLSCQLSPSMDAQNMEVKWYRNDPFGLVHHYSTSQVDMEQQRPEYQGRTEFLKENITKGHVALRIHPIQLSDGGEYACFFESSTYYNDATFQMLVTGKFLKIKTHTQLLLLLLLVLLLFIFDQESKVSFRWLKLAKSIHTL